MRAHIMKRNILFFNILLPLLIIGLPKPSLAVKCLQVACASYPLINVSGLYCATSTTKCYGNSNTGVVSCTSCPSGYDLTQETKEIFPDGLSGGSCTVTYGTCVEEATVDPDPDCDGTCDDCESTDWSAYTPEGATFIQVGYQRKVMAACNKVTCVCTKTYSYRCADGYYGSTLNGTSGCTMCPRPSGSSFLMGGADSIAGNNRFITQCFVEEGSDTTGSYVYEPECYYTN